MSKSIRSNVVKESLLDYNKLANSLKENTESAVKNLLNEAVRDTYAKLLSEGDDEDYYEEDEVEDTKSDVADDAEIGTESTDGVEGTDADMEPSDDDSAEIDAEEVDDDVEESPEGDGEEWAEFDKYKMSDNEYNLSDAEDDEIVKVYKLMKNDDQILVHKDGDKVSVQDNETGAEYLIDLGSEEAVEDGFSDEDFGTEDDLENNFDDDMNESTEKMFELVLEYDSNVGYTDNYQKKDVMTNPGMSEPGKNVNDWDAGVPKGDSKPWSGYPGKKNKADKPFNAGKGKQVEESVDKLDEEAINELTTVQQHTANTDGTSLTHRPNNPRRRTARNARTAQNGQETGTADNPYGPKTEGIMRRIDKTLKENKELKDTLGTVMTSLKEAAVTNHNLGQIIKLISENSTTKDEKKEIIERFSREAKTIEASKSLYESISHDLKQSHKMNITEDKALTVESSNKINETPIYKSQDMQESLDLMHRMIKL